MKMIKEKIIAGAISLIIVAGILAIPSCVDTTDANASIPMELPRGAQQYEFRISGESQPIKVVEFVSKFGDRCILVYTAQRNVEMELSCNHNK